MDRQLYASGDGLACPYDMKARANLSGGPPGGEDAAEWNCRVWRVRGRGRQRLGPQAVALYGMVPLRSKPTGGAAAVAVVTAAVAVLRSGFTNMVSLADEGVRVY